MYKKITLTLIIAVFTLSSQAQIKKANGSSSELLAHAPVSTISNSTKSTSGGITWMSLKEAMAKNERVKKKILLDFFTDWCGWCKKMDAATYGDPAVIAAVNKYFYAVKFNAEKEEPINFRGKNYMIQNQGTRGTHTLVTELLGTRVGYPTTSFLNSDLSNIQAIPGYIQADEMVLILNYFGEDKNKSMSFEDYKKSKGK